MKKQATILATVLVAVSLMGFGCNPFKSAEDKVNQTISESVVSGLTGGKVKMDSDNNAFEFKDNKTGNSVSIGENAKIPDDFPKDVPLYPGAKTLSVSMTRTGEKEAAANLKSADEVKKVIEWYTKTLKDGGWTEDQSATMSGSEIRSYKKDTGEMTLTIFPDTETKGSVITLGWKERVAQQQ